MGWEEGVSIATRERCGICHKVSAVGFHVPDYVWHIAVPGYFRETVMCVACFVSFADERMIAWDKRIDFYPVSLRTHLDGIGSPGDQKRDSRSAIESDDALLIASYAAQVIVKRAADGGTDAVTYDGVRDAIMLALAPMTYANPEPS